MAMAESRLMEELREAHGARRQEEKERRLLSRRGVRGEWDTVPLQEVPQLAAQLKKKATADAALLSRLQKALLEGREWADAFLAVPGAFAALVGHLSGPKPRLALRAAFCLCNLSVHTEALNWRLTKAAAPYLMVHIDGMEAHMQETCIWTIGHLALVDDHSWEILEQLGVLQKLTKLLENSLDAVAESTIYALTHIVIKRMQTLNPQQLDLVASSISARVVKLCDCSRLLFWLSSTGACDQQMCPIVQSCVEKMSVQVESCDLQKLSTFSELTFLLRFLANVASGEQATIVIDSLAGRAALIHKLSTLMRKEVCWLLSNLTKHPSPHVRQSVTLLIQQEI